MSEKYDEYECHLGFWDDHRPCERQTYTTCHKLTMIYGCVVWLPYWIANNLIKPLLFNKWKVYEAI